MMMMMIKPWETTARCDASLFGIGLGNSCSVFCMREYLGVGGTFFFGSG
jgi:hypothetical protein